MPRGFIDAAPLQPFLRAAIARRALYATEQRGKRATRLLAEDIAARFDTNPASEERQIWRLLAGEREIRLSTADRWAIALDLHPVLVWGDDWPAQVGRWPARGSAELRAYNAAKQRESRERARARAG